jgi:hypothetical protein
MLHLSNRKRSRILLGGMTAGAMIGATFMPGAPVQAADASMTVFGHPHSPSGLIKSGTISFFVHSSNVRVGYGQIKDGQLVAHIKRSKKLSNMAAHHGGMINLDLAVKKKHRLFMRGVRLSYSSDTIALGDFRMANVSYRSGSDRSPTSARMRTTIDGVHTFAPVLMFVPHGPDEVTHYEFTSEGSTSAEIGYGVSVKTFKASGSMEVANNRVGKADGSFGDRGKTKGLNGGLYLRMPMTTTTSAHTLNLVNAYGVTVSHVNTYTSRALWDGHVREKRGHPFTCGSNGISDQFWFTSKNSTLGYTKESGQSVKAVGSLGAGGLSAQVTTEWGKGVMQHFKFNLKSEPGFYYCLGGRGGSWLTGDKVGISTFPKRSSKPCKLSSKVGVNVVLSGDDPGLVPTEANRIQRPGC